MKKAIFHLFIGKSTPNTRLFDIAYLLFRVYCGISIAIGAGLSKVFHKINEQGGDDWANLAFGVPQWFIDQVGGIGFTFISPTFWAYMAVYGEFIGGLLIAFGLLTRFSALQLAFQFFVVSFIWYNEPEPFAMYYQQLIFWSFVMVSAVGGGRFSLDNLLSHVSFRLLIPKKTMVAAMLLLLPLLGFSQAPVQRIMFTVSNSSIGTKELSFQHFDHNSQKASGYGYRLGGLHSHTLNMPVGTRVYEKRDSNWVLLFVVSQNDGGRKFDIRKSHEISQEQYAQEAKDKEAEERAEALKKREDPTVEERAQALNIPMIAFEVTGSSLLPKMVYIRAELPFHLDRQSSGFGRRLSMASRISVSFPVGTKLYRCEGAYWNGEPVNETLWFVVGNETENKLIKL